MCETFGQMEALSCVTSTRVCINRAILSYRMWRGMVPNPCACTASSLDFCEVMDLSHFVAEFDCTFSVRLSSLSDTTQVFAKQVSGLFGSCERCGDKGAPLMSVVIGC